jgi:SNF2 family DNA or RNA helicase
VLARRRPKYRSLLPHQEECLQAYLPEKDHAAFFMQMRLGKTLTAIRWVRTILSGVRTILVVCPLTVGEAWERELGLEYEQFISDFQTTKNQRLENLNRVFSADRKQRIWLLTNYEALLAMAPRKEDHKRHKRSSRELPVIAKLPWDVVLLDESVNIKSPDSITSNICCEGFRQVRHRGILTGFPSPEGLLDLYQQFRFLHDEFMGCRSYWEYRNKYFYKAGFKWQPKTGVRQKIKSEIHKLAFIKTRGQCNMGSEKVYQTRYISLTREQLKLTRQIEETFGYITADGATTTTKWNTVKYVWLQRIAGGFSPEGKLLSDRKSREILNLLRTELYGEKVIVWFKFLDELALVNEILSRAKIPCTIIRGEEPYPVRRERIKALRSGEVRVLLVMEKCAKYGSDLSTSDTAIYYSNEESGNVRTQSEDRIIHPSKTQPVLLIDLVSRGTVDEDKLKAVRDKKLDGELMMIELRKQFYGRRFNG